MRAPDRIRHSWLCVMAVVLGGCSASGTLPPAASDAAPPALSTPAPAAPSSAAVTVSTAGSALMVGGMFNLKCAGHTAAWGTGALSGLAIWPDGQASRELWSVPGAETVAGFAAGASWAVVTTVVAEQGQRVSAWTVWAVDLATGRGHALARQTGSDVAVPTPTVFGDLAVWDVAATNALMQARLTASTPPARLPTPSGMQPVRPFLVDDRTLLFQDAAQDPDRAHEGSYLRGGPEYRLDLAGGAATPLPTGAAVHFASYGGGTLVWADPGDSSVHALTVADGHRYDLGPGGPPLYASRDVVLFRSSDLSTHRMLLSHLGPAMQAPGALPGTVDATVPLALCDGHIFAPGGDNRLLDLLIH